MTCQSCSGKLTAVKSLLESNDFTAVVFYKRIDNNNKYPIYWWYDCYLWGSYLDNNWEFI